MSTLGVKWQRINMLKGNPIEVLFIGIHVVMTSRGKIVPD